MNVYLFIGGPKDGEWIKVDRPPVVIVSEFLTSGPDRSKDLTNIEVEVGLKEHLYSAERIRFGKNGATIYRHSNTTIEEVLTKLLENYKPSA